MQLYTTTSQKRTGDYRPAYILLGIDDRGAHHVYRATDETVHVVHPDVGRIQRHDPAARVDLDAWMATVAEQFGWTDRFYGQSLADLARKTLAVA